MTTKYERFSLSYATAHLCVKLACSRIPKSWAIGIGMYLTVWTGP